MSDVFTNEDVTLLDKSMRLRERIIDNFARLPDDQLPRKPAELMAVVNLAESVDRTIIQKAKLNIDKENGEDDKVTKTLLKQLMLDLHTNKPISSLPGETTRAAPEYVPTADIKINDGELIKRADTISLEEG